MKEKTIEQKLVKTIKSLGGMCPKLTCPGTDGMPDRICLLPEGKIFFAEMKVPGKKPRPLQEARIAQLEKLGFKTFVIDSMEGVADAVHSA